ncbi:hypothetical protein DPMN_097589 [Dreissena polymorpha]|uniref:Uncharacterized protein n=1 Tax=Dreissena polymorpha TaxID=45954 RepID=A0A9D4R6I1_DREPO|nr:hypothetical protein DPMN_097589 [Dreissena polymorpha]
MVDNVLHPVLELVGLVGCQVVEKVLFEKCWTLTFVPPWGLQLGKLWTHPGSDK